MLNIARDTLAGVPLLALTGRLDGVGAAAFDAAAAALDGPPEAPVVLDLAGLDYVSSAGLRSLLRLARTRWTHHARVWLAGLQTPVRNVFEMSALLPQFEVVASRAEAAQRLAAAAQSAPDNTRLTLGNRAVDATRLATSDSALHHVTDPGQGLACWSLGELGLAVGRAGLGATAAQAAEAVGDFFSTGRMICVRPPGDPAAPPDFIVAAQPADVPVYVAEAWRFVGHPALFAAAGEGTSTLDDLTASLQTGRDPAPAACGWVLAALDADASATEGWVGVGFRTAEGLSAARWVRAAPLALGADPGHVGTFLQAALREESIAETGAPGPAARAGRWIAWLYALEAVRPAAPRQPEVLFEGESAPPEEWDWIARHLYADAGRVRLRRLCGGFSAATFHAESHDREGRRLLPTVLKLADPAFSAREDRAYDLYVSTYILNNSAVRMGRCARNAWVGLRYNFLGITGPESHLAWIGDHVVRRPPAEVLPLFDSLFTRILAPWYGQARPASIAPYREHDPRTLFRGLVEEARTALGIDPAQPLLPTTPLGRPLPNPYYVLEHLYPARAAAEWPGMSSIVHGDLNLNNILLDEKENLYVIDFSETHTGDLCSDFSRMEPLLLLQMTRLADEADLAALLRYLAATTRPDTLFDPPAAYDGTDPFLAKAHPLIRLLRQTCQTLSAGRAHPVPYLLGVLRWTLPIVVFRQLPLLTKQASCYAAAVLAESLLAADPEAARLFAAAAEKCSGFGVQCSGRAVPEP